MTNSLFSDNRKAWLTEPLISFDQFLTQHRHEGRELRSNSYVIYRGMFIRLQTWLQAQGRGLFGLDEVRLNAFLATRELNPRSRHRYLLVFTALYRHLNAVAAAEANPAQSLLMMRRAPEREDPEALTPAEVQALLASLEAAPLKWKDARHRAMLYVLVGAGLRSGELLRLQRDDIFPSGDSLALLRVRSHGVAPGRSAYLFNFAREELRAWCALRDSLDIPGKLLFPAGPRGEALSAATLFRQVQNRLGIAEVSRRYEGPTLLRNTCGAMLLACFGIDKAQDCLGHEQARTTELLVGASKTWVRSKLIGPDRD